MGLHHKCVCLPPACHVWPPGSSCTLESVRPRQSPVGDETLQGRTLVSQSQSDFCIFLLAKSVPIPPKISSPNAGLYIEVSANFHMYGLVDLLHDLLQVIAGSFI